MGTDGEKSKHNPDGENLKSLLKKSGKKDKRDNKKPNRVVFNETKNEFFDADYIILIREECEFDDEDDESVCTCYQHEMVRLTCCEPNCNCSVYEEIEHTPQSPKFAPPIEFVDAVTLSPPEGYKDMELEEQEMMAYKQQMSRRTQRTAVCRECSANQEHEADIGDNCKLNSDNNEPKIDLEEDEDEKEKIDQSQQTTPTSPNNSDGQKYMLADSSLDEAPEETANRVDGSPVSGILKGGRLWRQLSKESAQSKPNDQSMKNDSTSDDDSSSTRMVRFIEEEKKDSCKASPETDKELDVIETNKEEDETSSRNESPGSAVEPTEMMLTFKLGNHVLISNNSLKPNSAVRQLFPCTKPLSQQKTSEEEQQYLVTAESLRAFEEAKRSRLPQIIQSAGTNDSIKRVIERNTLRRSLARYEPKSRKNVQKTDNSLEERIKQLTCDIDEISQDSDELSARVSPTGEEGCDTVDSSQLNNKCKERNFSPSSSSTSSSNSSSMSSTYRKITDLFGKREKPLEASAQNVTYEPKAVQTQTLPDLGAPYHQDIPDKIMVKPMNPTNENRKQFLPTLAPLTACVSNVGHPDEHYYHLSNHGSVASSTGSEYTLDDIDEALVNEENKKITPDVLAGTPASESGDELLVFVQQDANRIERIKKKYENDSKKDEDDEHDDYGFNRRPSVRGIKPRFGSTTEILQQIQNQIHLPTPNANIAWPYYSETDLNTKQNVMPHYQTLPMEAKMGGYAPNYRQSVQDNPYQNCGNQTCYKEVYKTQTSVIGVEIDCQTMPKNRNGRPMSPPPQELSRNYHQTMVYIPYNHIESYQPVVASNPYQNNDYYRYNQMNKKYIEPIYQQKLPPMDEQYCNSNVPQHKVLTKSPYPNNYQPLLVPTCRSESPLSGNFAMARSTQTSMACLSSCNYYQSESGTILRYRETVHPPYKPEYGNKINRHSFPSVRPRYNPPENLEHGYMEDPNIQHNGLTMNGYYNYLPPKDSPTNSPTKARYIERGVPEGAASVSPQDSVNLQSNSSTNTSPTLAHPNPKPLFYAMNVEHNIVLQLDHEGVCTSSEAQSCTSPEAQGCTSPEAPGCTSGGAQGCNSGRAEC
ncbi:hypothetical protein JTB14_016436 [Gonioctena quinquepunctata]|nr:hypothetical protein JTB14_016436 [Gonioctena quinquepunctata]